MGDIISGTLIIIFILIAVLINKQSRKPDTEKLIRNLIGLGAVLGLVVSFTQHGIERLLGLFLFYLQLTSVVLLSTNRNKIDYILLCFTLLLQIPVLNFEDFSYKGQTIFSAIVQEYPQSFFDLEPGSYVTYINTSYINETNKLFPLGLNLTSLILLVYFIKRRNIWKDRTIVKTGF